MKFTLQLPISKPRMEVWKAFDNPENMKRWQPSLISFERVSGEQGRPGAVAKLTYEENGRQFALMEKVTHRQELQRLDGVYENAFADTIVRNTFMEQGSDQTLWAVETEYKFKTLLMRILGPIMKKNFVARTQKEMERFKEIVEGREGET
jgi:carbon monoxide dehydrogenase subunit G